MRIEHPDGCLCAGCQAFLYRLLHEAVRLVFLQNGKEITMLVLTDVQACLLSIQPLDAKGNPAAVDGAPSWSVSDSSVLSISPSADGMTANISAVGPVGNSQVSVSADADLGEGVKTITGTLDVQVTASEATTLNISAGAPF